MRWLHVHPEYLVGDGEWALVRLAAQWRDGLLPEAGGVGQQAAYTVAAIEIILTAWGKLQSARDQRNQRK